MFRLPHGFAPAYLSVPVYVSVLHLNCKLGALYTFSTTSPATIILTIILIPCRLGQLYNFTKINVIVLFDNGMQVNLDTIYP